MITKVLLDYGFCLRFDSGILQLLQQEYLLRVIEIIDDRFGNFVTDLVDGDQLFSAALCQFVQGGKTLGQDLGGVSANVTNAEAEEEP